MRFIQLSVLTLVFLWASVMILPSVQASDLEVLKTTIETEYTSGGISDPDVKQTLLDLIQKAQNASDNPWEDSLRQSFVDTVEAFKGYGISNESAETLSGMALF